MERQEVREGQNMRKFIITAVAAVALLSGLAGAQAASAAVTARPAVTPAITCDSGYVELYNGYGQYLTANGSGSAMTGNTSPSSCFISPTNNGDYQEMPNEAGNCANWDNTIGVVIESPCQGQASELWLEEPLGGGPRNYLNDYAEIHVIGEYALGTLQTGNDAYVGLWDAINDYSTWSAAG